jgi:peptide/nickel transport system permease protein
MTTTVGSVAEPWAPSGPPLGASPAVAGRAPLQLFWQRFREDRVATVALGFIVLEILLAIFAPWVVKLLGHPPDALFPDQLDPAFGTPTGPSRSFLFGVDTVGRDVFSRVLYGARVSLEVAIVATACSVALGVVLGMVAGYYRGPADTFISRLIDVTRRRSSITATATSRRATIR